MRTACGIGCCPACGEAAAATRRWTVRCCVQRAAVHPCGFAASAFAGATADKTVDTLRVARHPSLTLSGKRERRVEAPPGFEPGMEVLQISLGFLSC